MAELADRPPQSCAQCGSAFSGRKRMYCGKRCAWVAAGRRKGKRPLSQLRAEERGRTHRQCPECGREFRITRHDNHSKGPQITCSVACRGSAARRVSAERDVYGRWSARSRARKRDIVAKLRAARTSLLGAIICYVRNPKLACADCGSPMGRWHAKGRYCADCRQAKVLSQRRVAKAWRKAVERAVSAEKFDPLEIFERDGWRCHLCHRRTPRRLRGGYHPRAPELDHIVPLSKGGAHTRANTACSCRECNAKKSDRILGQPSLLAA